MGRFKKGILGGFSGKIGTVIGSNWKGIDYMRSLSTAGNRQSSPAQLAQQLKFGMVIHFVQSMNGLFRITFKNFADKMTAINNAMSYTLKHAVNGNYPGFGISFGDVLISRGDLPNAIAPSVSAAANSILTFNWTNNSGTGIAAATDKAILVAYDPVSNSAVYTTGSAARSTQTDALNLAAFSGKTVHTYISFISGNGKELANSIYTGEVVVS